MRDYSWVCMTAVAFFLSEKSAGYKQESENPGGISCEDMKTNKCQDFQCTNRKPNPNDRWSSKALTDGPHMDWWRPRDCGYDSPRESRNLRLGSLDCDIDREYGIINLLTLVGRILKANDKSYPKRAWLWSHEQVTQAAVCFFFLVFTTKILILRTSMKLPNN